MKPIGYNKVSMSKPVILTGLRANNDLHIGNYFGALLPLVDMANKQAGKYQINLFVPDLHSFTTPIDHSQLQAQIMNNLRLFVAAGLDLSNPDLLIYRQSYVPAHSQLTVILNSFVGMGEMERMTQYKDKSVNKSVSVGLFDYPVLMAADILLYAASYVPVGDDQSQHLEITRDIAQRLNKKFDEALFTVPLEVSKQHQFFGKDQGLRIKNLQDPAKKMSKSDGSDRGIIFLGDEPGAAAKKIMSAATDDKAQVSMDVINQPGISNLLQILALLKGEVLESVVAQYRGKSNYGDFKNEVAKEVSQFLRNFQSNLRAVDDAKLMTKIKQSEVTANKVANQTLSRVMQAVGLRPLE